VRSFGVARRKGCGSASCSTSRDKRNRLDPHGNRALKENFADVDTFTGELGARRLDVEDDEVKEEVKVMW
jgi:hypothetical protein